MKKISLLLFFVCVIPLYAQPHSFTFDDMIQMDRLGSFSISPDGSRIAFEVRDYSLENNNSNTDLYLMETATDSVRRLTRNKAADFNPVFSTDGNTIYFLSSRTGSVQIHAIDLTGGEPRQVTDFPVSVGDLKLSPKGSYFSFSASIYLDAPTFEETAEKDRKIAEKPDSAMVFDELFIRHWDTWEDGKWKHVFIMPVDGNQPVDIMKGLKANCPSEPFGGAEEYNWSPDESTIAFTAKAGGSERAWITNFDVYEYTLASGSYRNLTAENTAWDTTPVYAPDGNHLYYLAMQIPGYEADRFRLMRLGEDRLTAENLTETIELSPGDLTFSDDGQTLYFTALNKAHIRVYAFDPATRKLTELVDRHTNQGLQRHGKMLYFMQDSLTAPAELFSYNLENGKLRKRTGINDDHVKQIQFAEPEEFWFTNRDGVRVHGWLLRPPHFDKRKSYPLAFYIHGGPQGSWEDHFHYRWNLQILPAQGYVAVAIDFRGSTGYGDDFREAISGHWGDRPYHDLMDGLDYILKEHAYIDENRMGALGASYGGYMINWIAGQAPDRFQCLINHDGGFDEFSSYYNTEELWFPEYEFGGTPYENPELYDKWSPARYVQNWKTPMLVIHGGRDYRVVPTEGFSTFNALQRRGIPSKLIFFPDENHFVLKPANSRFWHQSVIQWMDTWCK